MMMLFFAVWVFLLAQISSVSSQVCKYQDKACECDEDSESCEFILTIEEHQTFASYNLTADRSSRRTAGRTYFINATGFYPAVSLSEFNSACFLSSATYDYEFEAIGCSVPMTVDGVTYRRFIAVNGRIPGPTLIVSENQTVKVRVQNDLTSEAITVHWHGMHQRGTPWMDGVGFISQYPILAGEYFDYIFEAYPAGTHWYHSHVGAQRTDGLFGALVVREKKNNFRDEVVPRIKSSLADEPYNTVNDVPSEHTFTLLDWQREDSLDLFVRIHSSLRFHLDEEIGKVPTTRDVIYNPTASIDKVEVGPVPYWTGLINGLGRNESSDITPLSIFKVSSNAAYRFRVVGAQSLYAYRLSIDGHKLTVIATDGHFIQPVTVEYLIVHSGERYDFIINTYGSRNQEMFWILAETLEILPPKGRSHSALAVLVYDATSDVDWKTLSEVTVSRQTHSCSSDMPCKVLNCPFEDYPSSEMTCVHLNQLTSLISVEDITKLPNRNDAVFFNFGFDGESFTSAINGINFLLPVVSYQTECGYSEREDSSRRCEECKKRKTMDCQCTNVVKIANDETFSLGEYKSIIMVFSAIGQFPNFSHPIHLHGHSFYVVHIGHGRYDDNNELFNSTEDISCEETDPKCRQPNWANGIIPKVVMDVFSGTENRIRNNLIRKDTVIVPAGGYVVVAFQADNPGYWFLHCHIEVHQLEGMGVLIQEYDDLQQYCPPDEINSPGHFDWTTDKYKKWKDMGLTCASKVTTSPSGSHKPISHVVVLSTVEMFTLLWLVTCSV